MVLHPGLHRQVRYKKPGRGLLQGEEVQLRGRPACSLRLHGQAFPVLFVLCRKRRNPDQLSNGNVQLGPTSPTFHSTHHLSQPLRLQSCTLQRHLAMGPLPRSQMLPRECLLGHPELTQASCRLRPESKGTGRVVSLIAALQESWVRAAHVPRHSSLRPRA